MKTKFLVAGIIMLFAPFVLLGVWYALSALTFGLINLITLGMGDLCCWSTSCLSCLAGIVFVILGLVLTTEVVAANP